MYDVTREDGGRGSANDARRSRVEQTAVIPGHRRHDRDSRDDVAENATAVKTFGTGSSGTPWNAYVEAGVRHDRETGRRQRSTDGPARLVRSVGRTRTTATVVGPYAVDESKARREIGQKPSGDRPPWRHTTTARAPGVRTVGRRRRRKRSRATSFTWRGAGRSWWLYRSVEAWQSPDVCRVLARNR